MTLRQRHARGLPGCPRNGPAGAPESSTIEARSAALAFAFDHEHARLYDALKVAQNLAEMAGHDDQAAELHRMRELVAEHIHHRWCER